MDGSRHPLNIMCKKQKNVLRLKYLVILEERHMNSLHQQIYLNVELVEDDILDSSAYDVCFDSVITQ